MQSLNRYGYVTNNPATLNDPLGLQGWNPADPCSDIGYATSHAQCVGPPPGGFSGLGISGDVADATAWMGVFLTLLNNYGYGPWTGGGGGGGGGSTTTSPPAGQPSLAGEPNRLVSDTGVTPGPCIGPGGIILYPEPGMPCFKVLVITSATLGSYTPIVRSPGPGPSIENAGIAPTHKYKDFLACEASAYLFLPGSDTGGVLAVMNLALFAARAKSVVFPLAAAGADLATAIAIRETCIHEVYGPGHY